MTRTTPAVDVRRADGRPHTGIGWLESRHSFSFGRHYDPANTHFGLLLVSNDDVVKAGTGFDTHPHQDMEIVTWVLEGSLVHQDSEGNSGVLYPGLAQRMSAGTGILHSERNDSWRLGAPGGRKPAELARGMASGRSPRVGQAQPAGRVGQQHDRDVHFVQMWVPPDTDRLDPGYQQLDVSAQLEAGERVVVASGMPKHAGDRAITIHQRHAALYAVRLSPGAHTELPDAPYTHLFVARGSVEVEGIGALGTGDAARVTGSGGQRVTATGQEAEVLIWEMHATLG